MAFSLNDPEPQTVGAANGPDLENPKNLEDVIRKHDDLKAGAEAVASAKRGRGRPRKNPGPSGLGAGGGGAPARADLPPDLFTADSVRPFVELPFGLSNVWLKTDAFSLDARESDTLSHQGALVANLYAPGWNPKAVALAALALGFASIATKKLIAYMGERAEKLKAQQASGNAT